MRTPPLVRLLTQRSGVLQSRGSVGRVAAWTAAWLVIVSIVIGAHAPVFTDRAHQADQPPSGVRYVGPISRSDHAGFLPPAHDPDAFTVAWIGGSEIKLREISIPGAFDQRVASVGGKPLAIDSYNVIAPRIIDAIRALDTATQSGADAIVIALNPAWTRSEWSVRGWDDLDVSNVGTLWRQRSTWSWALALTAPDDYAWRLARAVLPSVEAQTRLNERAGDGTDWLDILERPDPADAAPATGDPRLPDGTAMWLVDEYGTEFDEDTRVGALIGGIGVSQHEAEFFSRLLLDKAAAAGVPVFIYATPFAPESLAKPEFNARAVEVEAYWSQFVPTIDSALVELEPRSLSRDYDSAGTFGNNVHMFDPGPFADVLVQRLCAQWAAADPEWRCA